MISHSIPRHRSSISLLRIKCIRSCVLDTKNSTNTTTNVTKQGPSVCTIAPVVKTFQHVRNEITKCPIKFLHCCTSNCRNCIFHGSLEHHTDRIRCNHILLVSNQSKARHDCGIHKVLLYEILICRSIEPVRKNILWFDLTFTTRIFFFTFHAHLLIERNRRANEFRHIFCIEFDQRCDVIIDSIQCIYDLCSHLRGSGHLHGRNRHHSINLRF